MSVARATPLIAALAFLAVRPGLAQVEVVPFLALHAPTASFPYPADPDQFSTVTTEQETGFGFGLAGRAWLDPGHGVQVSASRIGSDLTFGAAAHLTTISVAAVLRLPVQSIANPVWITVGAATVTRGGEGYDGVKGTTSVGGAIGIGSSLPVRPGIGVDLGLDMLVYAVNLERDGEAVGSSTQFDLRVHAGLAFTLAGDPEE